MKKLPIKWFAVFSLSLLVVSCTGCSTIRKAYWDAKVKEMCEKDGVVTVYEKIMLTMDEYNNLPKVGGVISVPIRDLVKENQRFFSETSDVVINRESPSVWKTDVKIKRKYDEKVIAKYSTFRRSGGDFITVDRPSTYKCPDQKLIDIEISKIFFVSGSNK